MKNRILIYLDQNIISSILKEEISLKPSTEELVWVYSTEHFNEINRSGTPDKYLNIINEINAKYLRINVDDKFRILESANLNSENSAFDLYSVYIQNKQETNSNETVMDPLIAWINGGGSQDLLENLPEDFSQNLYELTSGIKDFGIDISPVIDSAKSDISKAVNIVKEQDHDISITREKIGVGKGAIGNLKGPRILETIWEKISPNVPGVTMDQFFGFEPHPLLKGNYEKWPLFLSIAGCCGVLDILGYQAEKKIRKIDQLPNVRSDSGHIGMATFCDLLLSNDKRLRNRANAIYEYKKLHTRVGSIEISSELP